LVVPSSHFVARRSAAGDMNTTAVTCPMRSTNNWNNYGFYLAMRTLTRVIFAASALTAVLGCSRAKPVSLAIEGYNYTNRYISSFTVTDEDGNGSWGGDVKLSTPTAGGGGGTCCVLLDSNTKRPVRLRINWVIGRIDDAAGHPIAPDVRREAWVSISPPFPADPQNFEVHFYADGHVEAAITRWSSEPRVKLPEGRRERR